VDLIGLLADGDRLRVAAAIVLGHESIDEIRAATGLGTRAVGTALTKLVAGGLVDQDEHEGPTGRTTGYHLREEEIRLLARENRPPSGDADQPDAVLRAFFKGDRLSSIPASRQKRLTVLDVFAQDFEPGKRYTEKQVNLLIGKRYADTAAIRRYLVDEGFLEREGGGGRYWRAGGTFDV
jgi:hypothetical protein